MGSRFSTGLHVTVGFLARPALVALVAASLAGCASSEDPSTPARTEPPPAPPVVAAPAPKAAPRPKPAPPAPPAARNGDRAPSSPASVAESPGPGRRLGNLGETSRAPERGPEAAAERAPASVGEGERAAPLPRREAIRRHRADSRTLAAGELEMAPAEGAPATSALDADRERMRLRDEYIGGLTQAAYTFNPPSPIRVAQPVTVALWVDPAANAARLAEEMRNAFPESAARVESGATKWSPRMRATLTGPDFDITPVEGKDFDGIKDLSESARTEWSWSIRPQSPGKKKLHLLLSVVLPSELGRPRELPQISRDIDVEVTIWWVIDNFWEKYWKWILGGLGSAVAAVIAYWWKNRRRRNGQAPGGAGS